MRFPSLLFCALACTSLMSRGTAAAKLTSIYNFTGGSDGANPLSPLTSDGFGNFFGTTQGGGSFEGICNPDGCGTVYKIDRNGKLTTLHTFKGGTDGQTPEANVGLTLVGRTLYGNVPGTIDPTSFTQFFSLRTDGTGYKVLYGMTREQGESLVGSLQAVPGGIAFGLGAKGGRFGRGTLFFLSDAHAPVVVHDFAGGSDGDTPTDLIEDSEHNLFGSTQRGGECARENGCGVIFEYAPTTRTYTVLYAFQGGDDGSYPLLGSIGSDGTLYGVTKQDGANKQGVLFALKRGNTGYDFTTLSPIRIRSYDGVANAPALTPSGALIGGTAGGTYVFQDGKYSISYADAYPVSYGRFLTFDVAPNAIASASAQNGQSSACTLVVGCGFIYYQR